MEQAFKPVEDFRRQGEQGRTLINRSRELLQSPSFDPQAFAAVIEEASRDRAEFDRRFSAALVEAARGLSPAGRKLLATRRP
jgi:hypothetical protein